METVRIGVIGIGTMGVLHAKWIDEGAIPRAKLTAVSDVDHSRLAAFPNAKHFAAPDELIRSGLVDAVVIATPHYSHTPIGIDALKHGLHVLVEKPISVHKADCERLLEAHTDPKLVFSTMFLHRLNPAFAYIKQLISSGELGKIMRINWTATHWFRTQAYYDSGSWRASWAGEGGGVLLNQCPHQLDLFQWFFGMPERVCAFCSFGKYHKVEVEDDVTAYLEYPDGRTAVLIMSTGEFPGTDRLEVATDRGKLVYEDGALTLDRTEVSVSEFCHTTRDFMPQLPHTKTPIACEGKAPEHPGVLRNFVNAILEGEPLVCPASEGIKSVELANAFLLSSLRQKTIELPVNSAEYWDVLQRLVSASAVQRAGGR